MTRSPVIVVLIAFALATGACTDTSAETTTTSTTSITSATSTTSEPDTTTTSTSTTTTVPNPASPLNGIPSHDPDLLDRRVMAVKVDNHVNSRPQSGLLEADAVIELLVEGGITRFVALFHDNDTGYVGPIRSARPTDATLLRPLGAVFAISGAQRWVLALIRAKGVKIIGEGNGMFRTSHRRAPHNLYGDTEGLRDVADGRGYSDEAPPHGLYLVGDFQPAGVSAERIVMDWSPGGAVTWQWDGGRYLRFNGTSPHNWTTRDGESGQISAEVLIVILARRYTAYPPGSGTPVPALDTVGSGKALIFAGGEVLELEWVRDSETEPFTFTDSGGSQVAVPVGFPWIAIFPKNRSVTWQ